MIAAGLDILARLLIGGAGIFAARVLIASLAHARAHLPGLLADLRAIDRGDDLR